MSERNLVVESKTANGKVPLLEKQLVAGAALKEMVAVFKPASPDSRRSECRWWGLC